MQNPDRAYLAAVIDCEAYLGVDKRGYVRVEVEQVGCKWLAGLAEMTDCGHVRAVRTRPGVFRWAVTNRDDVAYLLEQTWGYVGKKKDEMAVLLARLDGIIDAVAAKERLKQIRSNYAKEQLHAHR